MIRTFFGHLRVHSLVIATVDQKHFLSVSNMFSNKQHMVRVFSVHYKPLVTEQEEKEETHPFVEISF